MTYHSHFFSQSSFRIIASLILSTRSCRDLADSAAHHDAPFETGVCGGGRGEDAVLRYPDGSQVSNLSLNYRTPIWALTWPICVSRLISPLQPTESRHSNVLVFQLSTAIMSSPLPPRASRLKEPPPSSPSSSESERPPPWPCRLTIRECARGCEKSENPSRYSAKDPRTGEIDCENS